MEFSFYTFKAITGFCSTLFWKLVVWLYWHRRSFLVDVQNTIVCYCQVLLLNHLNTSPFMKCVPGASMLKHWILIPWAYCNPAQKWVKKESYTSIGHPCNVFIGWIFTWNVIPFVNPSKFLCKQQKREISTGMLWTIVRIAISSAVCLPFVKYRSNSQLFM